MLGGITGYYFPSAEAEMKAHLMLFSVRHERDCMHTMSMWRIIANLTLCSILVYFQANMLLFTATCFSNVAVMGSLDVRLSVCLSVTLVSSDHIH